MSYTGVIGDPGRLPLQPVHGALARLAVVLRWSVRTGTAMRTQQSLSRRPNRSVVS
jgi:hypothetical protein